MSVGRVEGSSATALVNLVEAMLVRAQRASGCSSGQSATGQRDKPPKTTIREPAIAEGASKVCRAWCAALG